MSIQPVPRTIDAVFSTNYSIDFYQRDYKWTTDQIVALLSDVFFKFDSDYEPSIDVSTATVSRYSWYYLSTFVTNTYLGEKFVVDGQQRLTSLTLILIKLHSLAVQQNLEDHLIEWIKGMIYGASLDGRQFRMGANGRGIAFNHLLNGLEVPEPEPGEANYLTVRNLITNYATISAYLDKKLADPHRLKTFIYYFTKRIQLVELDISDSNDVAMVFEVINDRGERLAPYEVLKGELLGQLDRSEIDDKYLGIWNESIGALQNEDAREPDRFLQLLFRSRYAQTDADFRDFENDYHRTAFSDKWADRLRLKRNPDGVKRFLLDVILPYFQAYKAVGKQRDRVGSYVYLNSVLNEVDRQNLLILASVKPNDPDLGKKVREVARLVDRNYSLLQLMGAYNSNAFAESFIYLLPRIRDESLENIQKEFDARLLADFQRVKGIQIDDPFQWTQFKNTGYELGARFLRYFFSRVDNYINSQTEIPTVNYYDLVRNNGEKFGYHVEHILADNQDNRKLFEDDEEQFYLQRNRLGGLVLLRGRDNSSSSNEKYAGKLETYQHGTLAAQTLTAAFYHSNPVFSRFVITSGLNFRSLPTFGPMEIEERQQLYFELVKRIWGDSSFPL